MLRLAQRAALLLSLLSISLAANATPITLDPADQTVELGDQVQIDILIDPNAGTFIGGFDLVVNFDASILSVMDVMFGESLFDPFFPPLVPQVWGDNGTGSISIAELSNIFFDFTGFQDGDTPFLLASVFFNTIGVGNSDVSLTDIILSDEFGFPLDPTVGDAVVNVNEAPVAVSAPGTLALFLIGLAALSLRRRQQV